MSAVIKCQVAHGDQRPCADDTYTREMSSLRTLPSESTRSLYVIGSLGGGAAEDFAIGGTSTPAVTLAGAACFLS